jgi:hypothetical protein
MRTNRQPFDPLSFIPSPAAVRQRLNETRVLARKLEILLDVATRLSEADSSQQAGADMPEPGREVARAD